MARIVIEEECETCHGDPHKIDRWTCPDCVDGFQRRVLDPGSFVLIEKEDGEWPLWATESLSDPPLYELSPSAQRGLGGDGEAVKVKPRFILDALAGGEQP